MNAGLFPGSLQKKFATAGSPSPARESRALPESEPPLAAFVRP